ncbi:hypothetical protein C8R48DRAFT_764962 [Suillus tomentosus]|nr:hypothetical protein C8R48DRAFT_764962 [Suillus tomentosus]
MTTYDRQSNPQSRVVASSGHWHLDSGLQLKTSNLTNLKDRFAKAIRHTSILGPKVSQNDLIVLLTVWDKIVLPIVNVLQHDLKLTFHSRIWSCTTASFTSIPLHAAHTWRTNTNRCEEPCLGDLYTCSYTAILLALIRSRQLMKKHVPPSFVGIGQGGGTRVVKYAIRLLLAFLNLNLYPKLKDNRTVSFFLDVPLSTPLRNFPALMVITDIYYTPPDTMKIQSYYLTILAAAAGVNAALASTCIYDCQDPDASANCGAGWGLVWNNSLNCNICCTTS